MTRSELVQKIINRHHSLNLNQAEKSITIFIDEITAALAKGNRVELRGFGVLTLRQRKLRTGRNPRTGELVNVEAKSVPFFKAGKYLKECLNSAETV